MEGRASETEARRPPRPWLWPTAIAAGLLYARFGPDLGIPCPAKAVLDVPCPACGGTRAMRALARADLWTALTFNPLVTLLGILGIGYAISAPMKASRTRAKVHRAVTARQDALLWAVPVVLGLNWIYLLWAQRV